MHESVSPAFCFVIKSVLFQVDSAKFHIKINVFILKFKIIRRKLVKSFAKVCKNAMKSGGKMAVGGWKSVRLLYVAGPDGWARAAGPISKTNLEEAKAC